MKQGGLISSYYSHLSYGYRCDNQVIRKLDTRFSVKSVCLLWYVCIVQRIKGIFVISIRYRSLNVNRVKWKIAIASRGVFVNFYAL
jgi:hypothetical protein